MVKPIPYGMHSITPHLLVDGAAKAIEFYRNVFGAEVVRPISTTPDGKVMHAHLKIGDSHLMMADAFPKECMGSPKSLGGTPVVLTLYVPDVDATWKKATDAGAKPMFPLIEPVLGRPIRHGPGPVRAHVGAGDAHRGPHTSGDRGAREVGIRARGTK